MKKFALGFTVALFFLPGIARASSDRPVYRCAPLKDETLRYERCRDNYHARWVRQLLAEKHRAERTIQAHVVTAIRLGAIAYGQSSAVLIRKASCESHLWPYAQNPSGASGLFQFLPSTWRSTPYGGFSIWNPFAQALAAAWMHRAGRGGEWSCR